MYFVRTRNALTILYVIRTMAIRVVFDLAKLKQFSFDGFMHFIMWNQNRFSKQPKASSDMVLLLKRCHAYLFTVLCGQMKVESSQKKVKSSQVK